METGILIRLLLAHIITDFALQPGTWVKDKQEKKLRSPALYWHTLLTGIFAYAAMLDLTRWELPLIIMVTHFAIDAWKIYRPNNLVYFLIDQALHVLVILTGWLILSRIDLGLYLLSLNLDLIFLYAAAFAFIIWPAGYIVSYATASWRKKLEEDLGGESLEKAGKYIGILERILILVFVLTGRYETIGLLIAAKSILRFNESKARKHTEYVLIGTMLSFVITLTIGLALIYLIRQMN